MSRAVIPELYAMSGAVDGTGVAFRMAAIQNDGLSSAMKRVRISLEEISLQIATHLIPHVQRGIEIIGVWVNRFASLDESTQRNVIRFAAFVAAIGPVLSVGGKFVSAMGAMVTAGGAVATAIGSAGGALTTFGNLKLALSAQLPIKTKALGILALAFKKLWVAIKGPAGLAMVTLAGLTAGLGFLISRNRELSDSAKELTAETERVVATQQRLTEASTLAVEQFANQRRELQIQSKYMNELADNIEYLANKQELSAGEMQRLQGHVRELNASIPSLALSYNEVTGSLNMTTDALREYISIAQIQASLDLKQAEQNRLRREAIELEEEHYRALEQLKALEYELGNVRRGDTNGQRYFQRQIDSTVVSIQNYSEALQANGLLYNAVTVGIDYYSQALEELQRTQQQAELAIEETTIAMAEQQRVAEMLAEAQDQAWDKIQRSLENYKRITTNAFSTISESAAQSVQELTSNLQENTRDFEAWSIDIAKLAERGVDEGLIQQFHNAGPAMAATVRGLVQASDEELYALNYAFAESTRIAVEAMKRELDPDGIADSIYELIDVVADTILSNDSMETALRRQITTAFDSLKDTISTIGFDEAGYYAVEGFTGAIDEMLPQVERSGDNLGESLLDGLTDTLETNSPSRATHRIGVHAGEGLIEGVKEISNSVADSAKTLAFVFINAIAEKIHSSPDINSAIIHKVNEMREIGLHAVENANFFDIGKQMTNGIANGLRSGGGIVSSTATTIINDAILAMRTAAQISSPSRATMEVAHRIGDGLIVGMTTKGDELAEVCKMITANVISLLNIDTSDFYNSANNALDALRREALDLEYKHTRIMERRIELEKELVNVTDIEERERLERTIQDLITAEQNYSDVLQANQQLYGAVIHEMDLYSQAVEELKREQEELARIQTQAMDKINQSFENYARIATNAFSTISENAALSVEDLTANLQENARITEEWSTNMSILAERGVDDGLIKQLKKAGPAARATLRKLVDASDDELEALNEAFGDSTRVAIEAMKRELDPAGIAKSAYDLINVVADTILENNNVETALNSQITMAFESLNDKVSEIGFDKVGRTTVNNLTAGINDSLPQVELAGFDISLNLWNGMKGGITSTISKIQTSAILFADSYTSTVANAIQNDHEIALALKQSIDDVRNAGNSAVANADFFGVGLGITDGLGNGIKSGSGMLATMSARVIDDAILAMRNAAQISSPSRRTMKLAHQLGDGLIEGMKTKGDELAEVCKNITNAVADNLYINPSELMNTSSAVLSNMKRDLPKLQYQMAQYSSPAPAYTPYAPRQKGYSTGYGEGATIIENVTLNVDVSKISDINTLVDVIENLKHYQRSQGGVY